MAVTGFARTVAPTQARREQRGIKTYATIDCGLCLMNQAWRQLDWKWSSCGRQELPKNTRRKPGPRYPLNLLNKDPVDLLISEWGHVLRPTRGNDRCLGLMVDNTSPHNRPTVILEAWDGRALLWDDGPSTKGPKTEWARRGYLTRCKIITATDVGGAILQSKLIVSRVAFGYSWNWGELSAGHTPRPMGNLLTPPGLFGYHRHKKATPEHVTHVSDPLKDPMPWSHWQGTGAWIKNDHGYRQIQLVEIGRGLGASKEDCVALEEPRTPADIRGAHKMLLHSTSLFHWEYLSSSIVGLTDWAAHDRPLATELEAIPSDIAEATFELMKRRAAGHSDLPEAETKSFKWRPPDLAEGGTWYHARLASLHQAVTHYPGQEQQLIAQGLEILRIHHGNYNLEGPAPSKLQLIWWEFPREHWDEIWDGGRMNFMAKPEVGIQPNGKMDADTARIAGEFVDELISLGVFIEPPEGMEVLLNAPLFAVPKPGQPGQWRIICNMRSGGQNKVVSNDPVYLNRAAHILSQLYEGGYTALIDVSKFFHQFKMHPDNWPYLGTVHPITGKMYVYSGLPMGSSNSPGLAGCFGQAVLRVLKEKHELLRGTPKANSWWTGFRREGYVPGLGYGIILE
jgi:hypothetical protein